MAGGVLEHAGGVLDPQLEQPVLLLGQSLHDGGGVEVGCGGGLLGHQKLS
jgi:hypothetical protein